jgi:hypothetical protein
LSDLKDLDNFEVRFANWLAWCRMRGLHQGHAGSIEGRYRSPQHWDPINPKPAWLLAMNVNDAVLVNRAFVALTESSPRMARAIKVIWFKANLRPQKQAQEIGCHWKELEEIGYRAKKMLENRLGFIEKKTLDTVGTR